MKIREGFVSNSSSSSFVVTCHNKELMNEIFAESIHISLLVAIRCVKNPEKYLTENKYINKGCDSIATIYGFISPYHGNDWKYKELNPLSYQFTSREICIDLAGFIIMEHLEEFNNGNIEIDETHNGMFEWDRDRDIPEWKRIRDDLKGYKR